MISQKSKYILIEVFLIFLLQPPTTFILILKKELRKGLDLGQVEMIWKLLALSFKWKRTKIQVQAPTDNLPPWTNYFLVLQEKKLKKVKENQRLLDQVHVRYLLMKIQ